MSRIEHLSAELKTSTLNPLKNATHCYFHIQVLVNYLDLALKNNNLSSSNNSISPLLWSLLYILSCFSTLYVQIILMPILILILVLICDHAVSIRYSNKIFRYKNENPFQI